MKKFHFLLPVLLFTSVCLAEGPLFRQKEPSTQQEFENVYQDIRRYSFLTNNTSGQLLIGQGNGLAPKWQSGGRILQLSQFSTTTSTSSTSSTYIDTGLSGSLTTTASGIVIVYITQTVQADAGSTLGIKVLRDGLLLDGPFVGVGSGESIAGLIYADNNPGSGSHTYKTQFARIAGAGTVRCQNNTVITNTSTMMLSELSQ